MHERRPVTSKVVGFVLRKARRNGPTMAPEFAPGKRGLVRCPADLCGHARRFRKPKPDKNLAALASGVEQRIEEVTTVVVGPT